MQPTTLNTLTRFLADENATLHMGEALGRAFRPPLLVFLSGDLGAGKTTLSRGVLRGLGHTGSVKSPTYTLVEPYQLAQCPVYHFDLYRLGDPEELEYLGLRDYLEQQALILMEWPERGAHWLPSPDLHIRLGLETDGRELRLEAHSAAGNDLIARLESE